MYNFLITIIIAIFLALLFLNIYFRVKVMKHYKYLVQNRVEFEAKHVINRDSNFKEILAKNPQHAHEIEAFANLIRRGVFIAAALVILITLMAVIIKSF
jgi:hypothetical protein